MNLVDVLIILAVIGYAIGGYRNGAVVGLCSLIGFFGGAALGAQLARPLGSRVAGGSAQVPVAIVCVIVLAMLGQLLAVWAGGRLRQHIRLREFRAVDSGVGLVLGVVSVLLVAWMVAVPLASSPYPSVVSAVDGSRIVRQVDAVMPQPVRNVYASLRTFVDRSGFPPVLGDLHSTRIVQVEPPDPAVVNSPAVAAAHPSVLKILSEAPSCNRGIEGSGFVYAPEHMITNAHVVAGTSTVNVQTGSGALRAHVVVFDPERDVAVLDVPGLKATPLEFAKIPAVPNASSIVLGYPENGDFDVRSARIRSRETISGKDIYGNGSVEREIYSIRSLVRSGNSGGPLITPSGQVLGVVFATALNSNDTGFVLTNAEIAPDANRGQSETASVDTGNCT